MPRSACRRRRRAARPGSVTVTEPTLGAWRRAAARYLRERGIVSAGTDVDWLAGHVLRTDRIGLALRDPQPLTPDQADRLAELLHRRAEHVPVQYLVGETDFWAFTLAVSPAVLIPRPETEGLVERVLRELSDTEDGRVWDVGTGSGAIALALARERPRIPVWASDVSAAALEVARANAGRLEMSERVTWVQGAGLGAFPEAARPATAVVSNPPYVDPADRGNLPPEVVDHEPPEALFAERSGLAVIEGIIREAGSGESPALQPGGLLALEIGETQGLAVRALLEESGRWEAIRVEDDLAGRVRYVLARRRATAEDQDEEEGRWTSS